MLYFRAEGHLLSVWDMQAPMNFQFRYESRLGNFKVSLQSKLTVIVFIKGTYLVKGREIGVMVKFTHDFMVTPPNENLVFTEHYHSITLHNNYT